jgi:uncharacterized protein (DUF3084 family)
MAGYILILAVILLGGAIATVGDRLGTKIGKARLSLFKLRPKNTAVLITILTGSIISASTLGVLLATNNEIRTMFFRLDEVIQRSRKVQKELDQALEQKTETQKELSVSRAELMEAGRRLRRVNDTLQKALSRQRVSEANVKKLQRRYRIAQTTLRQFSEQSRRLRSQISALSTQRQQLDEQRQRLLVQRDQISTRLQQADVQRQQLETAAEQARQRILQVEQQKENLESSIAKAHEQLNQAQAQEQKLAQSVADIRNQLNAATAEQENLRQERGKLEKEIADLQENRQRLIANLQVLLLGLRRGNVTIRAGQVLASGTITNLKSQQEALQAINALLQQARRTAIILTNPANLRPEQQVVQMSTEDVNKLLQQISDGQPYIVRILSALNYLEGEDQVVVVPQAAPNQQVFKSGEVVAVIALNPATLSDEQILTRINSLFSVANRQAIQAGMLPDPVTGTVGSFRQIELFRFVLALKERNDNDTIEIQAVTSSDIFSAGPLTLELVARRNQQVVLRS